MCFCNDLWCKICINFDHNFYKNVLQVFHNYDTLSYNHYVLIDFLPHELRQCVHSTHVLTQTDHHIFHIWMVSFLHELMQYANSNHISNQNKLHICHIWMVFPFMNWCNMFIQIRHLIKLSLTERIFEMIFSSWTEVTCSFNSFSTSNWTSHISHLNGFFTSCTDAICKFKSYFKPK